MEAFSDRPVQNQYHVHSLQLLAKSSPETADDELQELVPVDLDLVTDVFESLDGQYLKALVLGERGSFPLELLAHPVLSGMRISFITTLYEAPFACRGNGQESNPSAYRVSMSWETPKDIKIYR